MSIDMQYFSLARKDKLPSWKKAFSSMEQNGRDDSATCIDELVQSLNDSGLSGWVSQWMTFL